ncbi:hypothetical protein GCM10010329_74190 [Streptomyces spiroverticillatus]|uniref:Uncharacterized protein n=1 Tax=Streptomyces finlayi TaxID=67296 RepID=A0A919CEP7_9ACTN|nr:hypothetical protein [Streptomyces finlayi]GHA40296.1 hypothetical protein GCM10010329_74190 [Streptomyces spiroverticillatus]GHD15577.1 hypothetical protein GCM10010334_75880 [Streptomyces finlayi]
MALLALDSPVPTALWQGRLLTLAGLALLPWMGYLAATLPPAEAAAWIALDSLEAVCLLAAGARRSTGRPARLPAAGAALLLTADACVDLLTSAPGTELAAALAMALCAELPLAALCAALARRSPRPRTAATGGSATYKRISSR